MKILLLGSSFSGFCQRVYCELVLLGYEIDQHYGMNIPMLEMQLAAFEPNVIICPFLTHRIPETIWKQYTCLVVHPGIEGDRGSSSLDWAISAQKSHWGVTLLQAASEMDAGDIWGTRNFILRKATKTSIYKREVNTTAMELIKKALLDIQNPKFTPKPLNYNNSEVKGQLMPAMKNADRAVNWKTDTAETIIAKINASDTIPGLLDQINNYAVYLFGASFEPILKGLPGEILALKYGAICKATIDGAIWIRQAKAKNIEGLLPIKLTASRVLQSLIKEQDYKNLLEVGKNSSFNDIHVKIEDQVAYIFFDFYNGAASTEQCIRLKETIIATKKSDVKVLVFMGGENFFGNGIHLNVIEAAEYPAFESWLNINAIDDVVYEIINSPNHVTIAALRNNAGAGGAIVPLACDKVIGREGIVLNPHYQNMGLYGSEYWTYLLPKKVGLELATKITRQCEPMLATEAMQIGYLDYLFKEDWNEYHTTLKQYAIQCSLDANASQIIEEKNKVRLKDESIKSLASYREEELEKMSEIFNDANSYYHLARYNFVNKIVPKEACWVKNSSLAMEQQSSMEVSR